MSEVIVLLTVSLVLVGWERCVVLCGPQYFTTEREMLSEFRASHPEELGPEGKLKVCVGGGAGFIGSHIAKRLREEVSQQL